MNINCSRIQAEVIIYQLSYESPKGVSIDVSYGLSIDVWYWLSIDISYGVSIDTTSSKL